MELDINKIITEMTDAIKGAAKNKWGDIKDTAENFLQARQERLKLLADMRLKNEIDDAFFQERLKEEEVILESELRATSIITKAAAQQAANAAISVVEKAVKKILDIII